MSVNYLSCNSYSLVHSTGKGKFTVKKSSTNDLSDSSNSQLQKILSASRKRIANQENEIQFLKSRIEFLSNENQTFRIQNNRQEKELINIEHKDLNISKLLDQHDVEILILKNQLQKAKSELTQEQQIRKESETKLHKLRTTLDRTEDIISNKDLLDKAELKKQLDCALENLSFTKNLLETAQKKLNMMQGNYKVEMTNCRKTSKLYADKCQELKSKIKNLNLTLLEKKKLLEIQNIYSKRFERVKINRKCEETILCPNCYVKWDDRISRHSFACDGNQVQNRQNPTENRQLNQCKIVEDIRKILIEEIKIGKLSFIYKLSDLNLERPCFPIKPLKTDVKIDSPYIVDDSTDSQKVFNEAGKVNNSSSIKDTKSPDLCNQRCKSKSQSSSENPFSTETDTSERNNCVTQNIPEIQEDINSISEDKTDYIMKNSKSCPKYMYPNEDSIPLENDWDDDLETISVLNSTVNTNTKCVKAENTEGKNNSFNIKHLDKPHFMYKLPKTVIEDLKDKASLLDKSFTNISKEHLRLACLGSVNQRNVSFKVPVHKFVKCDNLNQTSS